MTTPTEEARWSNLRNFLEERFDGWGLTGPDYRAAVIVRELRHDGWRVPLPDHAIRNEPVGVNRPKLTPDRIRQHAEACRAALRGDDQ